MILLLLSLSLLAGMAQADPYRGTKSFDGSAILGPASGPDFQSYYFNNHRVLSADTLYTVRGQVYFEEGASLTIPAGTLILGQTASAIIIKQGAQIWCNGTLDEPVVFTSSKAPGQRAAGDWGGLVILGRAPINLDPENTQIEGGIIEGTYGGDDPLDNSGRVVYTRFEFGGYRFEEGNEINGLTMGGVGAGTEIHHVQVSFANDDSFEWFGGTVDVHHLVAFGTLDDCFDTDDGYTGRKQFLFGVKLPDVYDTEGQTNGFEADGRHGLEPFSKAIVSNVTLIGPERIDALVGNLPVGNTHQYCGVLRENTHMSIFNSVLVGFVRGWSLRDGSIQAAQDDILKIRNTSVAASYTGHPGGSAHDTGRWADIETWFGTPAYNNLGVAQRLPSTVGLTDLSDLTNPQPQPLLFSELDGTADFSDGYLAPLAGRYTFEIVDYRGAFVPDLPMNQQWTAGWTNFDPQNTQYLVVAVEDAGLPLAAASVDIYPNPFNPQTTLRFNVPRAGSVSLRIYDVAGRVVTELYNGDLASGQFTTVFDGANLASGTYFARLQGSGFKAVQKMQLVR
jgi:hypothetical protein